MLSILETYIHRLDIVIWYGLLNWDNLSRNQYGIEILKNYPNKIHCEWLSSNPGEIYYLKNHLDKINWDFLSGNPNAISLLEKNLDKMDIFIFKSKCDSFIRTKFR